MLRYFNFEPTFKLQWYCAQDLVQTLLRSPEFVIQINLKHDTITV